MRYVGRITEWQDERGFGFVTPHGGGDRAFVHIKEFERGSPRPIVGTVISFELQLDDKCRFHAARPYIVSPRIETRTARSPRLPRKGIAAVFLIAITVGCLTSQFPASLALIYAGMSAIAFVMYGMDKLAALNRRWRTSEATLQAVGLFGGWPGALFAQGTFRHKTSKSKFQIHFWYAVALNCAGLAWLLSTGHMATVDLAVAKTIAESSTPAVQKFDVLITPIQ